jgi:pyruvate kinase
VRHLAFTSPSYGGLVDPAELGQLVAELDELIADAHRLERRWRPVMQTVHPRHRASAANLAHYLALRRHDIRDLQQRLTPLGLSSLGRAEAHVLASLSAVRSTLGHLAGERTHDVHKVSDTLRTLLDRNTDDLLGPARPPRRARVMVTLPTEAATDLHLVKTMIAAGMDVARINTAHDTADDWLAMLHHVRQASAAIGSPCRVAVDLAGPKLRTGPIAPGPRVRRFRPGRDELGRPTVPATVTLTAHPSAPDDLGVADGSWLAGRSVGEEIRFVDARGAKRRLHVRAVAPDAVEAELWDTSYVLDGTVLQAADGITVVCGVPPRERALLLHAGDVLTIAADAAPVEPVPPGKHHHRIGCTLPAAVAAARTGHRVALDDGRILGVVVATRRGEIDVEITRCRPQGSRLRAEKGINLPDTDVPVGAITDADRDALGVLAPVVDLVQASFVRSADDVHELHRALEEAGTPGAGIVVKIETLSGFAHLPEILLAAMASERCGVMIARGDLAVEIGFGRLAEVQEEILWLCEAAHLPVIWATEVLDSLARTGTPKRSEVTDAAMAVRAEAVMLNKGPHIVAAIETLTEILARMEGHQRKKSPVLRRLRSWDRLAAG